jgi:D-amino peptidase
VRVIIVSDMEGVAGIVKWPQVVAPGPLYEEGRVLYTEEINAAVDGAFLGGATEVVVMDCHGAGGGYSFNSLIAERLDERCEWVIQNHWTEYTEYLEQGCDAALFVGMHARSGTATGVLNHTVSSQKWREVRINGVPVGETGINAALCGTWNCPVLLVTGDRATCQEARALLGDGLTTVEVKQGFGRFSVRTIHPKRARELIRDGARSALASPAAVAPYTPARPVRIEVDFLNSEQAEMYAHAPGVRVIDGLAIVSEAESWWPAWTQFFRDRA